MYNGRTYYFIKNLQGDVIAIATSYGQQIATYTYDAWGKCISTCYCDCDPSLDDSEIVNCNPFRYRGYYYDAETKLYYLQSRYYDPSVGRFINGDEADYANVISQQILEYNLHQYCYNNCVTLTDPNGRSSDQTTMGIGLQFEISGSLFGLISGCVGIEVIWYTSNRVRDAQKGLSHPYLYWYWGGGISVSGGNVLDKLINMFKKWLSQVTQTPSKIFSALNISIGFSACAFALTGYTYSRSGKYRYNNYKKFTSFKDYEGEASGRSYTAFHVKAYHACSDTCDTWGLGYDTNKFGAGYSKVHCRCLKNKSVEIPTSIVNKIQSKAQKAV